MRNLPFIFLGFGRMGRLAYAALNQIKEGFRQSGTKLDLLAVVEADRKIVRHVKDFVDVQHAVLVDSGAGARPLHELLQTELKLGIADRFIVYDATPTHIHFSNLASLKRYFPNCVYLGEKPLVTGRIQLQALDALFSAGAYCNFIETHSEVVLTLQQLIREGLVIEGMRFWRVSSVGVAKVLNPRDRTGVTGGALLDKCTHDLSVSAVLLQSEDTRCEVESAKTFAFMPHSLSREHAGNFATSNEHSTFGVAAGEDDRAWAADAAGYARLRWRSTREVPAEYCFGWLGMNHADLAASEVGVVSIRRTLAELGLNETQWLARKSEYAGSRTFENQDARIAVLECRTEDRPVRLVANFLERPDQNIAPFLYRAEPGKADFMPLATAPHGANSLCRVLSAVAAAAGAGDCATASSQLGGRVLSQVHHALFDIRDQMLAENDDPHTEWCRSVRVIREQLKATHAAESAVRA